MPYLSKSSLENLKQYKYNSIDLSPISKYILQPYWNSLLPFFPLWLAPNLITLLGLIFILINLLTVIVLSPDLEREVDGVVIMSFVVGFWVYMTLDAVDGKQARRTGSSSPLGTYININYILGELFDHGCDALNCSFGGIVQCCSMGLGLSWYSVYLPFLAIVPFYVSTWEEYHTGVLYLGYFNGPVEGLLMCMFAMILSGLFGTQIWHIPLTTVLPSFIPKEILNGLSIKDLVCFGMSLLVFCMHVPQSIMAVYRSCREKRKSFGMAIFGLFPIFFISLNAYVWLQSSSSMILKTPNLILFILTFGIVFGRMVSKIILAYLTKSEFPYFTILQVPMFFGALFSNSFYDEWILVEQYYLWIYFIAAVVVYLYWARIVINDICAFLGIECFRIPVRVERGKKENKES